MTSTYFFASPLSALPTQRTSRGRSKSLSTRRRVRACATPEPADPPSRPSSLSVCHGPSCSQNGGGQALFDALQLLCDTASTPAGNSKVAVDACGCLGHCSSQGANIGAIRDGGVPTVRVGVSSVSDVLKAVRSVGVEEGALDARVREALVAKEDGNALLNGGKEREAIAQYEAALAALKLVESTAADVVDARDSYRAGIFCNRSAALASMGEFGEALQDANSAIDLRPALSGAWRRKGDAEEGLGKGEAAASALDMAARLEPLELKKAALQKRAAQLRAPKKRWKLF